MPTLYVENVPEDLYTALKERARNERSSVAAEVISILKQMVPSAAELARRKAFLKKALQLSAQRSPSPGPHQSAADMLREDRER